VADCLLTATEFRFAEFCAEQKLKKRIPDGLLGMLKERAFIVEGLRVGSILEIEKMISDSCRCKIIEYDFMDSNGLFASSESLFEKSATDNRRLDLLHLRYRDLQYLHFEHQEYNREHIFGPAN
jgi:hypothetical protein